MKLSLFASQSPSRRWAAQSACFAKRRHQGVCRLERREVLLSRSSCSRGARQAAGVAMKPMLTMSVAQ